MCFNICQKTTIDWRNGDEWSVTLSEVKAKGTMSIVTAPEYATHLYNESDNVFLSGSYYATYSEALKCYENRVQREQSKNRREFVGM